MTMDSINEILDAIIRGLSRKRSRSRVLAFRRQHTKKNNR